MPVTTAQPFLLPRGAVGIFLGDNDLPSLVTAIVIPDGDSIRYSQMGRNVSKSGQGERLRIYRDELGMTQLAFGQTTGLTERPGTVSAWEGKVDLGDDSILRTAAALCVNHREVLAWLRDGGRRPHFLRILPGARPEEAWEGERRLIAARLRALADELDPPTPGTVPARHVVIAQAHGEDDEGQPPAAG